MNNTNQKKLYTIRDVIEITSLGRTSVYQAIKKGELVVKKFGAKSLVTAESIESFIASLPNKEKRGGDHA